jgi:hypothetical protein
VKRVLTSILMVGVGLWAAMPAVADTAPAGTVTAQPSKAGATSHLVIDAKGTGAGFGGTFPAGVTLALYKGFGLDLAAAGRCSDSDAAAGTCPTSSQIATGVVSGSASLAGLFATAVTAPIGVFLANASNGDLADVVVEVSVQGTIESARGQLIGLNDPTFGYAFRFDPLPTVAAPVGTTVTLNEFTLDVGASATGPGTPAPAPKPKLKPCRKGYHHNSKNKCVKNKPKPKLKPCRKGYHHNSKNKCVKNVPAKKAAAVSAVAATTVTHNLITNPATCSGSWPAELQVRYPDHTQTLDAAIACSP